MQNRPSRITIALCSVVVALLVTVPVPALSGAKGTPHHRWSAWTEVVGYAEWQARAGLQAVALGQRFLVMGGRGPFDPVSGTELFNDVWSSADLGRSWQKISDAEWPARGYFQALQRGRQVYVLGGQNFDVVPNPDFPVCPGNPPGFPCVPFIPNSTFFNDVWKSDDGANWTQVTPSAGWAGRAGLSAVVFRGRFFVFGGSQGDDVSTGGRGRRLFNDVWMSTDGASWAEVTPSAPWAPRAGGVAVVHQGFIYLLGGERGFTCGGAPGCVPERDLYFNDVWRTRDGSHWDLVTPAASWSARPGHQCVTAMGYIACFGGYGEPQNPVDFWVSRDGARWWALGGRLSPPWRAASADDVKYDFDALVLEGQPGRSLPSIFTFGGDRERFELPPGVNASRVDNDVWRVDL
ncbi:MAG: hypothetical protein OEW19_04490, partial [Acidobacteriota bacterium]|nr:hypothetical protein [Acidobacteriota bacterium]